MAQQNRISHLRRLIQEGIATEAEKQELRQLLAQEEALEVVPAPPSPAASGGAPAFPHRIQVNIESFNRGGQQFVPPKTPGIKDAICEGFTVPSYVQDQLWFLFSNRDGATETFRGALVTAKLNGPADKSGAWKVKDVLDALEVPYEVDEASGTVAFAEVRGRPCQVLWDYVDLGGKRELRIQNVYKASEQIQQAV